MSSPIPFRHENFLQSDRALELHSSKKYKQDSALDGRGTEVDAQKLGNDIQLLRDGLRGHPQPCLPPLPVPRFLAEP